MWMARPAPAGCGKEQVLPIDWSAIAHGGETKTNYQILPGDRLFIVDDKLVAANNGLTNLPTDRAVAEHHESAATVR